MREKSDIKIMLIDDEADFRETVKFWLQSRGYLVEVAPEGKTALSIIRKFRPDIVFLDLNMPVMDGVETLRNIRRFDTKLPVIIVTVEYANEEKFSETKRLGCSGFFPKKGSFEELEELIEVTVRTHKKVK